MVSSPRKLPSQRLAHLVEGRVQNDAGSLLLSSAGSPWAGFQLERLSFVSGSEQRVSWPTPRVGFVVSGAMKLVERRPSGAKHEFFAGPGSVTLWPQHHECATLSWIGSGEVIGVQIAPSVLSQVVSEKPDSRGLGLAPQRGIHDKHLARLLLCMEAEIRAGCPSGRLYGEALSLVVAAYIAARYSAVNSRSRKPKGTLDQRRLVRVLDYVDANLGRDLSVDDLATVAHLSLGHFSESFCCSVGVPPHQYILRERVSAAKRLLTDGHMSIAQVAATLGFSSQSHFGRIFRQMTGLTPKRYRGPR